MPKKKIEEAPEVSKAPKSKKTEFEVHTSTAGLVRTYSVEIHGPDAESLANEYAGKIGGSVR